MYLTYFARLTSISEMERQQVITYFLLKCLSGIEIMMTKCVRLQFQLQTSVD